jgi:hypothetical protein
MPMHMILIAKLTRWKISLERSSVRISVSYLLFSYGSVECISTEQDSQTIQLG